MLGPPVGAIVNAITQSAPPADEGEWYDDETEYYDDGEDDGEDDTLYYDEDIEEGELDDEPATNYTPYSPGVAGFDMTTMRYREADGSYRS
jgi:hypothetical protein